MSLTRVVSPATSCPVKIPVATSRLPPSSAPLTSKSATYSELTNSHPPILYHNQSYLVFAANVPIPSGCVAAIESRVFSIVSLIVAIYPVPRYGDARQVVPMGILGRVSEGATPPENGAAPRPAPTYPVRTDRSKPAASAQAG